jgi:hypothetical protein
MSTSAPFPKIDYPWTRFWGGRTETLDLSDYGFLVDPTNLLALGGYPLPKTYDQISQHRALILLGEPGMGKSWVLSNQAERTAPAEDGRMSFRADLRAYSSEALLYKRIFERETFQAWLKGDSHLTLYLDSLDEALLRIDTIAAFLANELPQLPTDRLSIRIACRTMLWPSATLEPALQKIWGEDQVRVVELAPLRRVDVIEAAKLQGIDPETFIPALFEASAVPFAIKPLTLNMLFDLYKRDGGLPRSVTDLYRRGCLTLCEESNDGRREARRLGTLTATQRFRVTSRVACITMFANRYAIWTGAEGSGVPEEDVAISALAGDREEGDFSTFEVTEDHIREVLDTGLFTSRGGQRMGWAHQGYAEFLAAQYLIDKALAPETILQILLHPSGGLVPQLAVVAAWIATLSKPVRDALIASEPLVLVRGDLTSWSQEDVAALTASLLEALDQRRANDLARDITEFYSRLNHPGLAGQLRPYLIDRNHELMARRAAIMIAQRCAVKGAKDDLLKVVLDPANDPHLRGYAISALRKCGDDTVIPSLLPIIKGEVGGDDPDDEMLGYALKMMWPNHLTAGELFPALVAPSENYFGSYSSFLSYDLVPSLKDEDVPRALAWAKGIIAKATHDSDNKRKTLADAILMHAWDRQAIPEVQAALVDYVQVCLDQHGDLLRGSNYRAKEEFKNHLAADIAGRASFLSALARRKFERIKVFSYMRSGFMQDNDLPWLFSVAPGGQDRNDAYSEETLCFLIEAVASFLNPDHFELLYAAAVKWPLLYQRFVGVFEGVPLDSLEAKQARDNQRQMESFKENKRPVLSPPPADRVAKALTGFEAGKWRDFFLLNLHLSLEPDSTGYWTERTYVITGMPGWQSADDLLRERIIKAAERYLIVGKTHVAQFIGKSQARSDTAAFRALILLKDRDAPAYARVSQSLWEKWAPGIAYLTQDFGDPIPEIQSEVYRDVLKHAPDGFVRAIQTLIRRERASAAKEGKQPLQGTSFYKLRELKDCWHEPKLCEMVLDELRDPANTEDQFAVLLDHLLLAKYQPAQDYAAGCVAEGKLSGSFTVAAVNSLIIHDVTAAWPTVWTLFSGDHKFAKTAFLQLASRYRFREDLFTTLTERELAEVYVLLETLFPRGENARQLGVHFIGPGETIGHLRDALPRRIEARGTPDAVSALRWVLGQLPELDWLSFNVQNAELLMRMRTWAPLAPGEVRKLTKSVKAALVQNADDLLRIIVASLRAYERHLHGEQNPVRLLWDRQVKGDSWIPVEEDAISDDVKLYLQRELADSGIVVNREVEVGRVPGAPIGKRTDIKINAVRRASDGTPLDTITAVIETKGCWNTGLFTSLTKQLFGDYMARLSAPVGVYLVGWFDKNKWDAADNRRRTAPDIKLQAAQERLDYEASAIPAGYTVRPVVIDCHLPAKAVKPNGKASRRQ